MDMRTGFKSVTHSEKKNTLLVPNIRSSHLPQDCLVIYSQGNIAQEVDTQIGKFLPSGYIVLGIYPDLRSRALGEFQFQWPAERCVQWCP